MHYQIERQSEEEDYYGDRHWQTWPGGWPIDDSDPRANPNGGAEFTSRIAAQAVLAMLRAEDSNRQCRLVIIDDMGQRRVPTVDVDSRLADLERLQKQAYSSGAFGNNSSSDPDVYDLQGKINEVADALWWLLDMMIKQEKDIS